MGFRIFIVFQKDKPENDIRCDNENQKAVQMTKNYGEGCFCVCKYAYQTGEKCEDVIKMDDKVFDLFKQLKVPGMFDLKNQIIESEENIKKKIEQVIHYF